MSGLKLCVCESWQCLRPLPNTQPNTSHYGINFSCAKCGALALRDDEIAGIKNESIWSKETLEFVQITSVEANRNEREIRCEECNCSLGTYYLSKPESKDPSLNEWLKNIRFPAGKIMYLRQSSSGNLFNKTILFGEEEVVRKGISQLTLASSLPKV